MPSHSGRSHPPEGGHHRSDPYEDRERDDWRRDEWRHDDLDREGRHGQSDRYPARTRFDEHAGDEYDNPRRTHYGDRYPSQWSPASGMPSPTVRGPHAGKGPVGFKRSDERVREMVCEALTDDEHVDATNIEVAVSGGEVTLAGTVEDRRMKRLAEDCVERISGVTDVHNQLRITGESYERHHRTS
jgi:hypothetical protein